MSNILAKLDITKSNRGKGKITSVDMTEGNIVKHILRFSIPLLMVNFLQQLYTVADAWVVGNFADNDAFAAVSSAGSLIFFITGFFSGIAIGGGVAAAPEKWLLQPLQEKVAAECYGRHAGKYTEIVTAKLGNKAGLVGAAMLCRVV